MNKRTQRTLLGVCAGLGLLAASCSSTPNTSAAAQSNSGSFPVSVSAANGTVRIKSRPDAIVSLSPTATEMLYAIGAGSQVKAVDKYSDYPKNAPRTTLDDLQPNVEAIVAYKPDLVVVPGDSSGLTGRLKAFAIPVLSLPPAATLADAYGDYAKLGEATGHVQAAQTEAAHVKAQIAQIVKDAPKSSAGQTYYYELDQTYFSVTSSTFIGKVLGLLGLRNIADRAPSAASSGGYPQLSAEFIVQSNPDWVFLADTICCGQTVHTVAARPGWSTMTAVRKGQVVGLNDDIASRWGPRIVDLLQTVESALKKNSGGT
ncbi:MAG TPA: ABC transporter substrate-binding protein [Acidimicrobiales bacterium]|nr:ABC transporter substrate-binding protein [Acidimicrobiales bacterium]